MVIEATAGGGLGFGYVNNMRPRGVVYYDAELVGGNLLRGNVDMLGASFELPPGFDSSFEFERE